MSQGNTVNIYQFKISLLGVKPRIWRRIQVPENYNFWEFHVAIQDAMGWFDAHLHEFQITNPRTQKKEVIGLPEDSEASFRVDSGWSAVFGAQLPTIPGMKRKIAKYFINPKDLALYKYDFGDRWEHKVVLVNILPAKAETKYPRCINGQRACPPEDAGGIHGYEQLLKIISNPLHKEYADKWYWLKNQRNGFGDFDPEAFDPRNVTFTDPKMRWTLANRPLIERLNLVNLL